MEINGISKISSSATAWAEAQEQSKLAAASSSTAILQKASTSTSLAVASAGASSSDEVQPTVSIAPIRTPVATQSTTVAGKSYSESVIKLGDAYVVSIPNPPGASASGSSIEAAESKLNMKLDTLV
jgi:hypothetical protein